MPNPKTLLTVEVADFCAGASSVAAFTCIQALEFQLTRTVQNWGGEASFRGGTPLDLALVGPVLE